jgi:hypothetical protein
MLRLTENVDRLGKKKKNMYRINQLKDQEVNWRMRQRLILERTVFGVGHRWNWIRIVNNGGRCY